MSRQKIIVSAVSSNKKAVKLTRYQRRRRQSVFSVSASKDVNEIIVQQRGHEVYRAILRAESKEVAITIKPSGRDNPVKIKYVHSKTVLCEGTYKIINANSNVSVKEFTQVLKKYNFDIEEPTSSFASDSVTIASYGGNGEGGKA